MTASKDTLRPDELALYHRNPRIGDTAAIAASLRANGQYKPVVVNVGTHTGRPYEVLAGNHTVKAVRDLAAAHPDDPRWGEILVHRIDVDDDRAARIVLADNRTAELGTLDDQILAALIDETLDGDLEGTGYDDSDLAEILAAVEETEIPDGTYDLPAAPDDSDTNPWSSPDGTRPGPSMSDPGPRVGEDGLVRQKDVVTLADEYAERATRLMVLTLTIPHFVWLQGLLNRYRADSGDDSNTDAVLRLVSERFGEEIPDADEIDEG